MPEKLIEISIGETPFDSKVVINGEIAPVEKVMVELSAGEQPAIELWMAKTDALQLVPGVLRGYLVPQEEWEAFNAWRLHVKPR